jgi:hypothetical protein
MIEVLREHMRGLGAVNDSMEWTTGEAQKAVELVQTSVDDMLGVMPGGARPNRDLVQKAIVALVGLLALAAPTYSFRENRIGLVDLGANAMFVMTVLSVTALDKTKSVQAQQDNFRQMCGFSLAMAAIFGVNEAMGNPMERDKFGVLVGTLVLATVGNTFPGAAGALLASGIGAAFSGARRLVSGPLPWQPRERGGEALELGHLGGTGPEAIVAAGPAHLAGSSATAPTPEDPNPAGVPRPSDDGIQPA